MLLTALAALAMVSTPEKLFEGIDPAWSPDGTYVACLTPFGREIQIYTLDGKLVSTIESKRGEKTLEIDSFAWFPNGEEMLISEQETNARIGGDEFVRSQIMRAPLEAGKFTVATTGELGESKMNSTTHVFKSLRFVAGTTEAYTVRTQFLPVGSRETAETAPTAVDPGNASINAGPLFENLREFHILLAPAMQIVLSWDKLDVRSADLDVAFTFKMDFVGGFDVSTKASLLCWTGNNSIHFRKLKSSMIIEYHMPREVYGLGRVSLSPDAKRVVFSAYEETDILRPENDKSSVYIMDVPEEMRKD